MERIISKKHRPVQKELLDKTNLHSKNNKITTQPTILIPSATTLDPTIINNSQRQNSFNTTQTYKTSPTEQNLDSLGKNNINKLIIKDNVTSRNTIAQQLNRNSNSSIDSDRQLTSNSNNSIPEKRKLSSDQNIKLLDKTTQPNPNQTKTI